MKSKQSTELHRTSATIRLLIVEDDPVYRHGLRVILEPLQNHVEIVAEAGHSEQAITECCRHHPDVVLLDLRLPLQSGLYSRALIEHGLRTIRLIRQELPGTRILVLSHHDTLTDLGKAIQAGAYGYLSKSDIQDRDSLIEAIESVRQGQAVFGPQMAELLLRQVSEMDTTSAPVQTESIALERRARGEDVRIDAEPLIETVQGAQQKDTARRAALADEGRASLGGAVAGPLRVFISYSHQNENMRVKFVEHLAPLVDEGLIRIWHDRKIEAGANWEGDINREIAEADIILLLVSPSFLASPYCKKELLRAIEQRGAGKSLPIPIILRPCDWTSVFNRGEYKMQALPRDNQSVASRRWSNQDSAFCVIAKELRAKIQRMRG